MIDSALSESVFGAFLILVRVGAIVAMLPGFNANYVTPRIRLVLALAITLMLMPILSPSLPRQPSTPVSLMILVAGEGVVGLFIGGIARVVFSALHAAGTMAAYFASLANAIVQDPVADNQSSTLAGFFAILGMVLIFITDLHHLMLRGIVDGYQIFPVGQLPALEGVAETITRLVSESFSMGLQLAAPFLIVGVGYQVGLGLLGRLMPQLPVFFVGLPIQVGLQVWVIMLAISGVMLVFLDYFAQQVSLS
ncbi:MAG: flagellar biosynthetic protein FliR [Hyphomicrobiales bacterium]|nr:flagellar biosynthetic protein FliR [Hyphomicrobiales bacterium]